MTDVLIHSHGSWSPSDGYFQLPAGCSIRFFTQFAKTLMPVDAYAVLAGSYTGAIEREIGPFHTVPNLKCSPISNGQRQKAQQKLQGGTRDGLFYSTSQPRLLKDVVAACIRHVGHGVELRFDWVCCQALRLKPTARGGASGVNARHYASAQEFLFIDRSGAGKKKLGRHSA